MNKDREEHGKKPFDDDTPKSDGAKKDNTSSKNSKKEEKTKKITQSTTDPESGLFVKGEHRRQFAYEAHTACDKNGFILEAVVTPGNVHDSVAFDDVYDKIVENFPEIETIAADSKLLVFIIDLEKMKKNPIFA
ncbi:MAG: transposase [Clostridia bacterium]|nr:transposase [Clostridia bacterium]